MKKILISLMTLVVVAGMIGGGAFAYFSDTETSTGNTFTAGTFDLKVDGQDDPDVGIKVTVGPIAPDESVIVGPIELSNAGSIPGVIDLHYLEVDDTGGANMDPYANASSEPEYVAEGGTYDEGIPNQDNTPVNVLSTHIGCVWMLDYDRNGSIDDAEYLGTLAEIECDTFYIGDELLGAGESVDLYLNFLLYPEADNDDQGDVSTFDIEFTLTQEEALE